MLADLHAVDVDAVGLGDLARHGGYVERQLKRWSTQWANSKTRELPVIDEIERRLRERIPEQQGTSIAHGDYRFGNCLVDPPPAGSTPCSTGSCARSVTRWPTSATSASTGPTTAGRPNRVQRPHRRPAASRSTPSWSSATPSRPGRDVSNIEYYRAFGSFRLAVIAEGVYARYLNGVMGDDPVDLGQLKAGVEVTAQAAVDALNRL